VICSGRVVRGFADYEDLVTAGGCPVVRRT
jgi:hypothetical protein